jgi:hypothetical protein
MFDTYNIFLVSPKVVILEGSTLTITEDKELRLTCKVNGSPHIKSMSWSMMDKNTMFNLYKSNSTLVVPKVNRNHSGVYICHAETNVGKRTAPISVFERSFSLSLGSKPVLFLLAKFLLEALMNRWAMVLRSIINTFLFHVYIIKYIHHQYIKKEL